MKWNKSSVFVLLGLGIASGACTPNTTPTPTRSPSLTQTAEPTPPPSSTPSTRAAGCTVQVNPGDDLAGEVNGVPEGSTVCIGGGTYDLGSASLEPAANVSLIGARGNVGINGKINAPVVVTSSAQQIITGGAADVNLAWLDVSGATGSSTCKPSCGRGIGSMGTSLTVSYSRLHNNHTAAFGGNANGMSLSHMEIDHNGSADMEGCCSGGVKSANGFTIDHSYVHDNVGDGIWLDVCGTPLVVHDNLVVANTRDGVRYESSTTCGTRTAHIYANTIQGNDTENRNENAGVTIRNSPNAEVDHNVFESNYYAGVYVTGAPVTGTNIHANSLNGDALAGCSLSGVTCFGNTP